MDERQAQIREGAGLEESRLNTDLIAFLQKWSTPFFLLIAAVIAIYWGYGRLQDARQAHIDAAFGELELASGSANPSPDALKRVAEDFADVRSVPLLAELAAGDTYLGAVRAGMKVGVVGGGELNADGTLKNEDDLLRADDRKAYLDEAQGLYEKVLSRAQSSKGMEIFEIDARYGLAATMEMRQDWSGAATQYEAIKTLATKAGLDPHPEIAAQRLASLDEIKVRPKLVSRGDLPKPKPIEPENLVPEDEGVDLGLDVGDSTIGSQVPDGDEADPGTTDDGGQ